MKKILSINLSFIKGKSQTDEEKIPQSCRDEPKSLEPTPNITSPNSRPITTKNRSLSMLNLKQIQEKSPRSNPQSDKKIPKLALSSSKSQSEEESPLNSERRSLKSKSPRNWNLEIKETQVFFEPSKFIISFDEWMKNPFSRVSFEEFLTEQQNIEQINFINHIERYKKMKSSFERYEDAKGIYHNYLSQDCFQQMNISSSDRTEFEEIFKQCNNNECPCTIFDKIYSEIYSQLKCESFPRYVNSYYFQEFCRREPDLIFERNLLKKK